MKQAWWKESVIYQIYPRSFNDSNGDGVGDIRGILEKLDYLQELGVGIVWLSPVYESPNDDNGYDISNYRSIMPEFGTLDDVDELIAGLHAHGMKIVMDLVANHTSDEHRWFQAARQSKDNPYRDYYIWRPNVDGTPPNNWASYFSGSAWELDAATNEWYLHSFSKKQPDLNWENPAVRREIYDIMHWWFQRGIDGFRMDVISMISKAPGLPDTIPVNDNRYHLDFSLSTYGPHFEEYLLEMKREVLSKYDTVTMGEMLGVSAQQARRVTHAEDGMLSMVIQFEHLDVDVLPNAGTKYEFGPLRMPDLRRVMTKWQDALAESGWNSLYLSNHDQPRSVSRFGDDGRYRVASAKMLATMLHMQRGTPYIYQGEEIGMTNVPFDSIADFRDIEGINLYTDWVNEKGKSENEALAAIRYKGRDNARTPVQWNGSDYAGFSTAEPWIKVNPNYLEINVAAALADSDSIFHYYKRLIALRKMYQVVSYGRYETILEEHETIYAFVRTLGQERLVVVLNFSAEPTPFHLPETIDFTHQKILISNYTQPNSSQPHQHALRPYEATVFYGTTAIAAGASSL